MKIITRALKAFTSVTEQNNNIYIAYTKRAVLKYLKEKHGKLVEEKLFVIKLTEKNIVNRVVNSKVELKTYEDYVKELNVNKKDIIDLSKEDLGVGDLYVYKRLNKKTLYLSYVKEDVALYLGVGKELILEVAMCKGDDITIKEFAVELMEKEKNFIDLRPRISEISKKRKEEDNKSRVSAINSLTVLTGEFKQFKIGDKVGIITTRKREEALYVTELIKEGRILKLENENISLYRQAYEVYPFDNLFKPGLVLVNNNLRSDTYKITIKELVQRYYRSGIDMDPEYYKNKLKWNEIQKKNLIKSIINRYSIGQIALLDKEFTLTESNYQIIDGKERLIAIIEYMNDMFKCDNRLFSELSYENKQAFLNHRISVEEFQESIRNSKSEEIKNTHKNLNL